MVIYQFTVEWPEGIAYITQIRLLIMNNEPVNLDMGYTWLYPLVIEIWLGYILLII